MSSAFITGPVPETFVREVTGTPGEFEQSLVKAWPAGVETCQSGVLRVINKDSSLTIRIELLEPRRIGLLALPRFLAHYCFTGGDAQQRTQWLAVLDRAMQRGGG